MPYVLSPKITLNSSAMWMEGPAYEKKAIYSISNGKMPPVNYDEHILRSHSLTHYETPAHTINEGKRLDYFYQDLNNFFGETLVIKLQGNKYESKGNGIFHWIISKGELQEKLKTIKKFQIKFLSPQISTH